MKTESEIRAVNDALTCKIEIESKAIPETLAQASWAGMHAAFQFVLGESADENSMADLLRQYPPSIYEVVRSKTGEPELIRIKN